MYGVTHSVAFQAIQNTRNINNVNWVERGKDWDGKKFMGIFVYLNKNAYLCRHKIKNDYRNYVTGGLKAQKHLARGIALGLVSEFVRPVRAKAPIQGHAFALTGRNYQPTST